jgi:hypothetical protein
MRRAHSGRDARVRSAARSDALAGVVREVLMRARGSGGLRSAAADGASAVAESSGSVAYGPPPAGESLGPRTRGGWPGLHGLRCPG